MTVAGPALMLRLRIQHRPPWEQEIRRLQTRGNDRQIRIIINPVLVVLTPTLATLLSRRTLLGTVATPVHRRRRRRTPAPTKDTGQPLRLRPAVNRAWVPPTKLLVTEGIRQLTHLRRLSLLMAS